MELQQTVLMVKNALDSHLSKKQLLADPQQKKNMLKALHVLTTHMTASSTGARQD